MGEISILDLKKGKKLQNKTMYGRVSVCVCVCVCTVFYSGAKGLGRPTVQWAVSQESPLQLSEGDIGVKDKQNFKGNQEK